VAWPFAAEKEKQPLTWKRVALMVGRTALAAYLIACLFLYLAQGWILFLPADEVDRTPADVDLEFEELRLATVDGETVHGWFVPAADADGPVILFCHGNAGNVSHRVHLARWFHDEGFAFCLWDYRGYGESTGSPGEEGTYRDADAVWEHLVDARRIDPARIVVHGKSLGGGVASYLAETRDPAGLVLESTFTSVPDIALEKYRIFPVHLLARHVYPNEERLATIDRPVLILHSRDDRIVPVHHGEALHAAAPQSELVLFGGGHNYGPESAGDAYSGPLFDFVRRCVER